jgi:DNA-binding transcriptional LysR family regulator
MEQPVRKTAPINMALLRLFAQVAEHGGIAAAARELDMSPSLATRKLAALERSLNVRLFERTTRSVKLTEAGEIGLRWARQALGSYEQVADDLASLLRRPSGTIRLAINYYAGTTYLPKLLDAFCAEYPEIRLSITTSENVAELVEEGYDLALYSGRIPDSRVVGVRLREFRRVLCASPKYLKRRGVPKRLEDLMQHDCLMHSTNEPLNWFFRKGNKLVAQPIRPRIEADNNVLLRELALAGLGIARLGHYILDEDLAKGRLVELLPEYKCVYSTGELPGLWLIYPNRRALFRTRALIDFLGEQLGGGA